MKELFESIKDKLYSGENVVMSTITASSGSVPRGSGARMIVDKTGRISGTVGGGAVEYKAIELSKKLLYEKKSGEKHYTLDKNDIEDIGMVCGGNVKIFFTFIEANDENKEFIQTVLELFDKNIRTYLIMNLSEDTKSSGLSLYSKKTGFLGKNIGISGLHYNPSVQKIDNTNYFIEQIVYPEYVYIFGGGHVSQALVPILDFVGFKCVVLEDREEFCRPELFSGKAVTKLINYEKISDYIEIKKDDYVCIMTRGHAGDTIVQAQVLNTPARYIGVIGSARKIFAVFKKLRDIGIKDEQLKRITSPIGLPIKAKTPAEIAISIAAQLIEKRAEEIN